MANRTFFGYSTYGLLPGSKKFKLYDIELVKRDLLNQFNTPKGARVMLPLYGTIIWNKLFEPLTAANEELIINDVILIVNSDPRVSLQNVLVTEVAYGLTVSITALYIPNNMPFSLSVDFNNKSATRD